jgi:hypothetical protein
VSGASILGVPDKDERDVGGDEPTAMVRVLFAEFCQLSGVQRPMVQVLQAEFSEGSAAQHTMVRVLQAEFSQPSAAQRRKCLVFECH